MDLWNIVGWVAIVITGLVLVWTFWAARGGDVAGSFGDPGGYPGDGE